MVLTIVLHTMARVSTYLNFPNKTEEAFTFYKSVFGGEFKGKINRFGEMPPSKEMPVPDSAKNLIMHMVLPITGGHMLMGSDAPAEMGLKLITGNNNHIMLELDTRQEADRIFKALSAGGKVNMPLAEMFWGDYYGAFTDKYGVEWMINVAKRK